jgi:hypothetical protein
MVCIASAARDSLKSFCFFFSKKKHLPFFRRRHPSQSLINAAQLDLCGFSNCHTHGALYPRGAKLTE